MFLLLMTQNSCALVLQSSLLNDISNLPFALRTRVPSTHAPSPLVNICESSVLFELTGLLKHHEYWPLHCLRVPPVQNEKDPPVYSAYKQFFSKT
jgi:hypothetical protein